MQKRFSDPKHFNGSAFIYMAASVHLCCCGYMRHVLPRRFKTPRRRVPSHLGVVVCVALISLSVFVFLPSAVKHLGGT